MHVPTITTEGIVMSEPARDGQDPENEESTLDSSRAAKDFADLASEATDLFARMAPLEARIESDDDLLSTATELERTRSLLDITSAHVATELRQRGATQVEHGMTVEQFLAQAPKQAKAVCKRRVRVAQALRRHFDRFDEAISEGQLSWAHAETIEQYSNRRIVDQLVELQPEIIDLAKCMEFDHWRRHVLSLCRLLDQDGGFDPSEDPESSQLHLKENSLGTDVRGNLSGENAVIAKETINKVADELFQQYSRDRQHDPLLEIPSRGALRAQAFIEICRRAQAVDLESSKPPATQTTLVITADDLRSASTSDGHQHPINSISGLCCDQQIQPLIIDEDGNPLHLGRSQRLASAAQRRAIRVRDGGCVFPGCDVPASWSIIHHVTPWHAGGRTDVSEMAMLCHHHHGVTHSNHWNMSANEDPETGADQTFVWTTPTGRRIHSQRHGVPTRPPERPRPRKGDTPPS